MRLSVVIPTANRPLDLKETLAALLQQTLLPSAYEIIVVDDGSRPPVALSHCSGLPRVRLVRLEGVERSAARNAGASSADGELLVFVDDDITVGPGFLEAHVNAQDEWPGALAVGSIRLPKSALRTPFGRFRQKLEDASVPTRRGPTARRNFCTAANMSICRSVLAKLGRFDESLRSAEDQDLALRHTSKGGVIAFLPEAQGVHRDNALDIRAYCRRVEWSAEAMVNFCLRHPEWPENVDRERKNAPISRGGEAVRERFRKVVKVSLGMAPLSGVLFGTVRMLERWAPDGPTLVRLYRLLIGIHIMRGYRHGLLLNCRAQVGLAPLG